MPKSHRHMREYKDTKKACSPVKNKLHAFVYIDDNVYINARGKVSLMCVCVCVCYTKIRNGQIYGTVFYLCG